jgi:hypothetical protein
MTDPYLEPHESDPLAPLSADDGCRGSERLAALRGAFAA